MHGQIVTTYSGKATTVCPDATATTTSIQVETQTLEPSCYPTHGPPHDKPWNDELIKLCRAVKGNFASVCKSNARNGVSVDCPGLNVPKGWPAVKPIESNTYWAYFEQADKAPEYCKSLFEGGGSGNKNDVDARIDTLCVPAFEAIQKKCTWNGGEVKNQCGTFKYQSCPIGKICAPGKPQG